MVDKETELKFFKSLEIFMLIAIISLTFISFVLWVTSDKSPPNSISQEDQNLSFNLNEYEEVCNEWRTEKFSKIIYPLDDGCKRFCNIDENIEIIGIDDDGFISIATFGIEAFDHFIKNGIYIYESTEDCLSCLNQTEPYIYTSEIEICTEMILVKKYDQGE